MTSENNQNSDFECVHTKSDFDLYLKYSIVSPKGLTKQNNLNNSIQGL